MAAAALVFSTRHAAASDPLAERLYNDGRTAAQAEDWNRACQLFRDSQNREPAPGTLLNLADCEEHRGKFVTAAAQYNAAARLFQAGDERIAYARNKATLLEARAAKLRVRVDGGANVECDGVALDAASLGTFIVMDPGEHVLTVKAPGRADMQSKIILGEGESRELQLSPGAPMTTGAAATRVAPAPSGSPATPAAAGPSTTGLAPAAANASKPNRTPAYVAFGIGAVGLGAGVVTGILALDAGSSIKSTCPNRTCASEDDLNGARSSADRARGMALGSTIGFGVGIAAAAVGTYFLLRKPSSTTVTPTVGSGSGGVLVQGSF